MWLSYLSYHHYQVLNWNLHSPPYFFLYGNITVSWEISKLSSLPGSKLKSSFSSILLSLWQYHCFLRKQLSWSSSTECRISFAGSLNSISVFASKLCFPGATPSQSLNMTRLLAWAHSYGTQKHSDSCPGAQDSQVLWPMSLRQHCTISCSHTTFPFPSYSQTAPVSAFSTYLPIFRLVFVSRNKLLPT